MLRIAALLALTTGVPAADEPSDRVRLVAETRGLVAFWDFTLTEGGTWSSRFDPDVVDRGYPVFLRRIGDPKSYRPDEWPYSDEDSRLRFDPSGPFGHAVRLNQGYVFAEVPRDRFDGSPLDVRGRRPFTLIAWAKFVGKRHLVAGIWDEGGWDKYGGRRQIALFGGLFGSKGVIGHISATGAASYPQSTAPGSQYARCRAIDGRGFDNNRWVAMAMTFDPARREVTVFCDGAATPTKVTDPVARDVFRDDAPVASNPYHFPWAIYSPRAFVLKFNGYNVGSSGIYEHWLEVDAEAGRISYRRSCPDPATVRDEYEVSFDLRRSGRTLLAEPIVFEATNGMSVTLPDGVQIRPGDEIVASLHVDGNGGRSRVGTEIHYRVREGAPFTFGRALGLGTEPIDHGTQLCLDGAAVFDRVLSGSELQTLSFDGQ